MSEVRMEGGVVVLVHYADYDLACQLVADALRYDGGDRITVTLEPYYHWSRGTSHRVIILNPSDRSLQ